MGAADEIFMALVEFISAAFMIFGGALPYIPQYLKMRYIYMLRVLFHRDREAQNFKILRRVNLEIFGKSFLITFDKEIPLFSLFKNSI